MTIKELSAKMDVSYVTAINWAKALYPDRFVNGIRTKLLDDEGSFVLSAYRNYKNQPGGELTRFDAYIASMKIDRGNR